MKYFTFTLFFFLFLQSNIFSEITGQIASSRFVCQETEAGNLLKKINRQGDLIDQNFTKVIRRQKRTIANLRARRRNSSSQKVKRKITKKTKKE